MQQLLPGRGVFIRMMFLMPMAEWGTRIVFSYLAACLVLRLPAPNRPLNSDRRHEGSQNDRPESVSGGGG